MLAVLLYYNEPQIIQGHLEFHRHDESYYFIRSALYKIESDENRIIIICLNLYSFLTHISSPKKECRVKGKILNQ